MQKKLDDMTILITTAGLVCGVGTFVILLIRMAINFGTKVRVCVSKRGKERARARAHTHTHTHTHTHDIHTQKHTQGCCYEVFLPDIHIMQIVGYIILGIVIFVVAVPEGLPLAVTIALAFSVGKMYDDMNQVWKCIVCVHALVHRSSPSHWVKCCTNAKHMNQARKCVERLCVCIH